MYASQQGAEHNAGAQVTTWCDYAQVEPTHGGKPESGGRSQSLGANSRFRCLLFTTSSHRLGCQHQIITVVELVLATTDKFDQINSSKRYIVDPLMSLFEMYLSLKAMSGSGDDPKR